MPIAYFPSLGNADMMTATFVDMAGGSTDFNLLVDSGFIGDSCFVLPKQAERFSSGVARPSRAVGALQGRQKRIFVSCRIDALSFRTRVIAIVADTSDLALPDGVKGVVGLRFLRYFRRWGAEQSSDGRWRFFLEKD